MKLSITITITALFWILTGCSKSPSANNMLLDKVEALIEISPDSASNILKDSVLPEGMSDKDFARWCMSSGKITDKIFNHLLPSFQLERAYDWYFSNGTPAEQVQISIYLGRSYADEGNHEKAMSIYTDALKVGEKYKLNNLMGYTYCYIGDLYRVKAMRTEALKKYKAAAECFKKENNTDSYACALRDIGREYVFIDSIAQALEVLTIADSVSVNTKNINVRASIDNALGNIHVEKGEYDKAKPFFLRALEGRNKMPNYMALIDLYILTDSIDQAKELLENTPQDDHEYEYSIKYLYYRIYEAEENYKDAFTHLKEYTDILDSVAYADAQTKIQDIEARYNLLKMQEEVNQLKNKQQSYIFISIICILALSLMTVLYLLYRKKAKEEIEKYQTKVDKMKSQLLNDSALHKEKIEKYQADLDKMRSKLLHDSALHEEKIKKHQAEINKMRMKLLYDSSLYKELTRLVNQITPGKGEPLITEEMRNLIEKEITTAYPKLYDYIHKELCPDLLPSEFQYCCLCLYGFSYKEEAVLLNINSNSAKTKRARFKKRLNISEDTPLREYLIENIH
ncbi:hypothetical protein [Bacteroides sp. UBA939]|uniref:hypothetical protein n=1 Tax=Bacteroides sp. UBA939 TaxID=1946092 RepID=UPI0025BEAE45|nr:hypothetical protein [Bacteroides sp. UBA939]